MYFRFYNGMIVTCSRDRSIAVWDMISPNEINLRQVLVGHRSAVNVVDFDKKYIVARFLYNMIFYCKARKPVA